jgi:hypothetical protein
MPTIKVEINRADFLNCIDIYLCMKYKDSNAKGDDFPSEEVKAIVQIRDILRVEGAQVELVGGAPVPPPQEIVEELAEIQTNRAHRPSTDAAKPFDPTDHMAPGPQEWGK